MKDIIEEVLGDLAGILDELLGLESGLRNLFFFSKNEGRTPLVLLTWGFTIF